MSGAGREWAQQAREIASDCSNGPDGDCLNDRHDSGYYCLPRFMELTRRIEKALADAERKARDETIARESARYDLAMDEMERICNGRVADAERKGREEERERIAVVFEMLAKKNGGRQGEPFARVASYWRLAARTIRALHDAPGEK